MTRAHANGATSPSPGTERGICLNIHENPPATSDPSPDTRAGQTKIIAADNSDTEDGGTEHLFLIPTVIAVILSNQLSN